ncbi:hypothetical protein AB1Y20_015127 [Prymnesium parvum]|uniref:Uncharacterized protein n=1 Tax=Prymnesium parvum TaxID=97485 RepID=A0AB34JXL6_PRYPA
MEESIRHQKARREREAAFILTVYAKHYVARKLGVPVRANPWFAFEKPPHTRLNDKALQEAAADNEWYTEEMIRARDKLRLHSDVVCALERAWQRIRATIGGELLDHEAYITMSRKIYLALKAEAGEGDFDPEDCLGDVEEDWQEDSGGKAHLGGGDFYKCWFQLADLNTLDVSAEEYAEFIDNLIDAICLPEGGYRDEQELLERIQEEADLDDEEFDQRRADWFECFNLMGPRGVPRPRRASRVSTTVERLRRTSFMSGPSGRLSLIRQPSRGGGAVDDAAAECHATGIHAMSGNAMSGNAMSGHGMSGHGMSGHAMSDNGMNGHAMSGNATGGHAMSGNAMGGNYISSNAKSDTMSGNAMRGQAVSDMPMSGSAMRGKPLSVNVAASALWEEGDDGREDIPEDMCVDWMSSHFERQSSVASLSKRAGRLSKRKSFKWNAYQRCLPDGTIDMAAMHEASHDDAGMIPAAARRRGKRNDTRRHASRAKEQNHTEDRVHARRDGAALSPLKSPAARSPLRVAASRGSPRGLPSPSPRFVTGTAAQQAAQFMDWVDGDATPRRREGGAWNAGGRVAADAGWLDTAPADVLPAGASPRGKGEALWLPSAHANSLESPLLSLGADPLPSAARAPAEAPSPKRRRPDTLAEGSFPSAACRPPSPPTQRTWHPGKLSSPPSYRPRYQVEVPMMLPAVEARVSCPKIGAGRASPRASRGGPTDLAGFQLTVLSARGVYGEDTRRRWYLDYLGERLRKRQESPVGPSTLRSSKPGSTLEGIASRRMCHTSHDAQAHDESKSASRQESHRSQRSLTHAPAEEWWLLTKLWGSCSVPVPPISDQGSAHNAALTATSSDWSGSGKLTRPFLPPEPRPWTGRQLAYKNSL